MTKPLRELMKKDFFSRPSFNFETVQRASKACGPLVKWVLAQVRFSEILDKVEPLRNEVQSFETQAETTKKQAAQIITIVAELEAKIAKYKGEYALLISDMQAIKSEMERVQSAEQGRSQHETPRELVFRGDAGNLEVAPLMQK